MQMPTEFDTVDSLNVGHPSGFSDMYMKTVLIVCNKDHAELRAGLQPYGYKAVWSSADLCSQYKHVDVILVEPENTDASDVAKLFEKLHKQSPATKIIVIGNEDIDKSRHKGVIAQLSRPLDYVVLANTIEISINLKREVDETNRLLGHLEADNQRLTKSNEMMQDALILAGHEWRAQLSIVSLASENLMRSASGKLNLEQKNIVRRIRHAALDMKRVANDYIAFAQFQDAEFSIAPSFIDPLEDLIEPVKFSFVDLLNEHRQTCRINIGTIGMLVRADKQLLRNVITNLLSNAIKYGERGGKIVFDVNERGMEDEISIWNSGQGVAPDDDERIFERFGRGKLNIAQEGSGVGLYLARKIIEAHGGRIWVESEPDAWANFIFTLPRHGPGKY